MTLQLTDNFKSNLYLESPIVHSLDDMQPFTFTINSGEKIILTSAFAATFTMTPIRGTATYVETTLYERFEVTPTSGSPDCYLQFTVSNR